MEKNNNKKKAKVPRDLTAEEFVHWLKAQDNMPHPLRTSPRVMWSWMKAMNTGLPEHILSKLRPRVMDLWQQYGSGFAWTREQVETSLSVHRDDFRAPVITTAWQRQASLPALAVAFPRSDWSRASRRAIDEDMAAEAAATEQQSRPEAIQPPPVTDQTGATAATMGESAKEDKKEGAKKDEGLAQDADAAGNVTDLPPTIPRPITQLPPRYVLRRDPRFDIFRERTSIDDLPSFPDLPPYAYPGPVPASRRPGTSTLAPANQQPSSPLDRAAAWSVAVADIEALQRKLYEEDLAKMEDSNEDEWTDEESVAAPEDDVARAECLQRDADFEELNRQFYRRFSQSRRSGRGDESSRRGQDGRSRSPGR